MVPENYIRITELCSSYRIDNSFVYSLEDYGLVEILTLENEEVMPQEQVKDLERMLRLHVDLEINLEGIDVINHLLKQIMDLQEEVRTLRNKLNRWEK